MAYSLYVLFLFSIVLIQVDSKTCWYSYSSHGRSKTFVCNPYEHCCGNSCCEGVSRFYRLWYFWFCVILALLFCSGGGYWYRKRVIQQRIIIGQPQTTTIVTMTNTSSTSADGTCTIPTGMTYQPGCYFPQQQQHAPPSYTHVTHQGYIQITPQGVMYQAPSHTDTSGPPPSYDSISNSANAGNGATLLPNQVIPISDHQATRTQHTPVARPCQSGR